MDGGNGFGSDVIQDKFATFDDIDGIEPVEVDEQKLVLQEGDWNLDDYVAKRLGSDKIMTGSDDDPLEYSIKELPSKSKIAILEDLWKKEYGSKASDYTEDEVLAIQMLREGKLEELHEALGRELGVHQKLNPNVSDDEVVAWKIANDFPNLSEDEVIQEVETLKTLPNYEKKVEAYKSHFAQAIEEYNNDLEVQEQLAKHGVWKRQESFLIDEARNMEDLFGFTLDDDVKNDALNDILSDGTKFHTYMETPEGRLQAAIALNALPKISEYVENLLEEIEELKKNQKRPQTVIETRAAPTVKSTQQEDKDGIIRNRWSTI